MTDKPRKPAWWMLYALVPVMGGLLLAESRASLSPGWHKGVQIAIILFVYGLVRVWLWATNQAMLWDGLHHDSLNQHEWGATDALPHSTRKSLGTALTPQSHNGSVKRGFRFRFINGSAHRREIRKCSPNLDRQSRRWHC
jgi:hypothetical protein